MSIHPNRNERSQQLLRLNDARCELERANTVEQIKQVRERAESVRSYAQNAALGIEIQNFASELKLQAERMGGRLLAEMRLRAGDRSEDESRRPRLREMGIDKNQSARWQLAATVPEPVFRRFLHEYHDTGREISSAALLRLAKRLREDPVDSVIVRSLDDCPSIATNSHLLALNWTSLETVGKDIDALADTVREACSHYQLMLNLIESICRKAKLTEETVEFRALQRYLIEIKRYLSTVDKSLQRLSRHPELNGFNSRHVSTGS